MCTAAERIRWHKTYDARRVDLPRFLLLFILLWFSSTVATKNRKKKINVHIVRALCVTVVRHNRLPHTAQHSIRKWKPIKYCCSRSFFSVYLLLLLLIEWTYKKNVKLRQVQTLMSRYGQQPTILCSNLCRWDSMRIFTYMSECVMCASSMGYRKWRWGNSFINEAHFTKRL